MKKNELVFSLRKTKVVYARGGKSDQEVGGRMGWVKRKMSFRPLFSFHLFFGKKVKLTCMLPMLFIDHLEMNADVFCLFVCLFNVVFFFHGQPIMMRLFLHNVFSINKN